jgi:hypothetical protein
MNKKSNSNSKSPHQNRMQVLNSGRIARKNEEPSKCEDFDVDDEQLESQSKL